MSEMAPGQMRELADRIETGDDHGVSLKPGAIAALRAAADQLEAGTFDAGYRNGYKVGYMHGSGKEASDD